MSADGCCGRARGLRSLDVWLCGRVAAATDAAQQSAPLYPSIGVDRTYVLARALGMTALPRRYVRAIVLGA